MLLFVGVCLMISVNVELILRSVLSLMGGDDRLRPVPGTKMAEPT